MSITIKQYNSSTVTPKDDAVMYDLIFGGGSGAFYGLAVTSLGSNQIHIAAGRLIVKGREIVIDEETVSVALSSSGTVKGQLYLHVDLSNTTTPAQWVSEAVATLTTLTQDSEFNYDNGVYDIPIATYSVSETAVSSLVVAVPTLSSPGTTLYSATLAAASWSGSSTYSQKVSVSGVTANTELSGPMCQMTTVQATNETLAEVLGIINAGYTVTAAGTITVTVFKKPTADIVVYWYGKEVAA